MSKSDAIEYASMWNQRIIPFVDSLDNYQEPNII